jgi:hypothetical protein
VRHAFKKSDTTERDILPPHAHRSTRRASKIEDAARTTRRRGHPATPQGYCIPWHTDQGPSSESTPTHEKQPKRNEMPRSSGVSSDHPRRSVRWRPFAPGAHNHLIPPAHAQSSLQEEVKASAPLTTQMRTLKTALSRRLVPNHSLFSLSPTHTSLVSSLASLTKTLANRDRLPRLLVWRIARTQRTCTGVVDAYNNMLLSTS